MSATGLAVFDKTLQVTNTWLDEIIAELGPDRQVAWHVLSAVLHAVRDRPAGARRAFGGTITHSRTGRLLRSMAFHTRARPGQILNTFDRRAGTEEHQANRTDLTLSGSSLLVLSRHRMRCFPRSETRFP